MSASDAIDLLFLLARSRRMLLVRWDYGMKGHVEMSREAWAAILGHFDDVDVWETRHLIPRLLDIPVRVNERLSGLDMLHVRRGALAGGTR